MFLLNTATLFGDGIQETWAEKLDGKQAGEAVSNAFGWLGIWLVKSEDQRLILEPSLVTLRAEMPLRDM